MGGVVLVYAFDPVEELDDRTGIISVDEELAGRLVAESRVELLESNSNDSNRFVAGSTAYGAARDALRAKRGDVAVRGVVKVRRVAKLER